MKKLGNRFLINFFNGIVILLPIAITIAIIKLLVVLVNDIVLSPMMKVFSPLAKGYDHEYIAKALTFLIVIVTIMVIGWGAKILFIKRIFALGEKLFLKLPIMGKVYNAVKQISSAFLGKRKTAFKQVVIIEYPRKGLYSIGFATGITKGEIKEAMELDGVNVFVPTSPNPTSGMFIVVPREDVYFLKMSVEEGMKLVISGGSVSPPFSGESQT